MSYDITEVAAWMVDEGYFIVHKGMYVVSAKFNDEVKGVNQGLKKVAGKLKVIELDKAAPGLSPDEWRDLYMKFIVDCKIPKLAAGGDGMLYEVNKFSQDALKVFRKMIEEEKIDLAKLTAITKSYYGGRHKMPLAITNYIKTGAWRTDYAGAPESPNSTDSRWQIG